MSSTAANFKPYLIGLGGKKEHGKDAMADDWVEHYGFSKLGMSDALAEAAYELNPWIRVRTEFDSGVEKNGYVIFAAGEFVKYRQIVDAVGYNEAKKQVEIREFLQALGTEVGRNIIAQDVWTTIVERRIREQWALGHHVALTGVRFPNEITMVKEMGGTTVHVHRPGWNEDTSATGKHDSETSIDPALFEFRVINDGTLEDLHNRGFTILNHVANAVRKAHINDAPTWPHYDH